MAGEQASQRVDVGHSWAEVSVDHYDKTAPRNRLGQGWKAISKALSVPKCTVASTIVTWKMFRTTKTHLSLSCERSWLSRQIQKLGQDGS